MMNINDLVRKGMDQFRAQDLHIAGQHNEIHLVLKKESQLLVFCLFPVAGRYGYMVVGQAELAGYFFQIRMVAHNKGNLNFQLSRRIPAKQVIKAVFVAGHEDGHPGLLPGQVEFPLHAIGAGDTIFKFIANGIRGRGICQKMAFQPHKKHPCLHIHMLVQIHYISAQGMDKTCYRSNNPFFIRTMYQESCFQSAKIKLGVKIRILSRQRAPLHRFLYNSEKMDLIFEFYLHYTA